MEIVWLLLAIFLIMIGLVGTLIPFIPGIPLIFLGYLVWGLGSHWEDYGSNTMIFIGIITLLSVLLDYYAGALGAKKFGASAAGVWGAVLGAILGAVFFNVIGLILGPFLGAVAGEMLAGKKQPQAWRAGWGAFLGFLAGGLFRISLGVLLTGIFLYYLIF